MFEKTEMKIAEIEKCTSEKCNLKSVCIRSYLYSPERFLQKGGRNFYHKNIRMCPNFIASNFNDNE